MGFVVPWIVTVSMNGMVNNVRVDGWSVNLAIIATVDVDSPV